MQLDIGDLIYWGRNSWCILIKSSLRHLLEQQINTLAQQCWGAKLLGYDFKILYKLGSFNSATDALSRIEELEETRRRLREKVD